jgi:hypothetical protein
MFYNCFVKYPEKSGYDLRDCKTLLGVLLKLHRVGSNALKSQARTGLGRRSCRAGRAQRDFESGKRRPRQIVRSPIKQALEEAGIEFLGDDGLRLKK